MPNRKNRYRDMEKYRKTCKAQRKRYYQKTAIYGRNKWTPVQDQMVLEHTIADSKLSALIHHSAQAIQIRRSRLKSGNF